jgi:hypothetical protein
MMNLPAALLQSSRSRLGLLLPIACAVLAVLASSAPAAAQFTVCNQNARTAIRVAISLASNLTDKPVGENLHDAVVPIPGNLPTTTSGSTAVAAGQCQILVGGSLRDVVRLYLFAWEPSNQAHTWGGDPQATSQHCLPTVASKDVNFLYHDHEYNNPPCAAGYEKESFMWVNFTSYNTTEYFKDPLEGVAAPATNQPSASAPSGKVSSVGGTASTAAPAPASVPKPASAAVPKPTPAAVPKPAAAVLSTAGAPAGNAVLTVTSGLPGQAGGANPLAGHTFVLLNQSYEAVLAGAGIQAPPGVSPVKGYLAACANNQPACQAGVAATNSSTISGVKANASGKAQLPGVPPGTYYFFCLGAYNNQLYKWDFQVQLKSGANSVTLDQKNAAAVN